MSDHERTQRARSWGAAAAVVGLVIGLGGGYLLGLRANVAHVSGSLSRISGADALLPQDADFSPVWKAWQTLDEKFVPAAVSSTTPTTTPEEQKQNRIWGMIVGMAASLGDPYTFFLPPQQAQSFQEDISGSFEGVGMEVEVRDNVLTVVSPLKGTPAERAGIRSADQILEIDGKSTEGMDINDAVQLIRGPRGSTVELLIFRDGSQLTIPVTRDVIDVPIVTNKDLGNGVYYIQLLTFTATSPDLFKSALRDFVESGDSKLVLDLRGNPGGYLQAAVEIASWFLPSGNVVVTEDYGQNGAPVVHRSLGYNIFNKNLQMVVLVDKGSASASEILADALRYYNVAQLVGSTTFGKGSVQELVPITADTSLKVTVARWLGPDGQQIPQSGITVDTPVEVTEDDITTGKDPQLERAEQILTASR